MRSEGAPQRSSNMPEDADRTGPFGVRYGIRCRARVVKGRVCKTLFRRFESARHLIGTCGRLSLPSRDRPEEHPPSPLHPAHCFSTKIGRSCGKPFHRRPLEDDELPAGCCRDLDTCVHAAIERPRTGSARRRDHGRDRFPLRADRFAMRSTRVSEQARPRDERLQRSSFPTLSSS